MRLPNLLPALFVPALFVSALFISLALQGLTTPARAETLQRLVRPARWVPIAIQGLPLRSFIPMTFDADASPSNDASCTRPATGDLSTDAVHIRAMEPDRSRAFRSSAFHGLTLGTTKAPVEKSIGPGPAPAKDIGQWQIFVLQNTRPLVVDFSASDAAGRMDIDPDLANTTGLSQETIERISRLLLAGRWPDDLGAEKPIPFRESKSRRIRTTGNPRFSAVLSDNLTRN